MNKLVIEDDEVIFIEVRYASQALTRSSQVSGRVKATPNFVSLELYKADTVELLKQRALGEA